MCAADVCVLGLAVCRCRLTVNHSMGSLRGWPVPDLRYSMLGHTSKFPAGWPDAATVAAAKCVLWKLACNHIVIMWPESVTLQIIKFLYKQCPSRSCMLVYDRICQSCKDHHKAVDVAM